jgi:DNA-binding MarR family transcriptional regulator
MRALARCLGISAAAATATADQLVTAGAAERFRDTLDRRLIRVVATVAGLQMAAAYRTTQVGTLRGLLGQMEPARQAVLALAMTEIARAMDSTSGAPTDMLLTPDSAHWTSN